MRTNNASQSTAFKTVTDEHETNTKLKSLNNLEQYISEYETTLAEIKKLLIPPPTPMRRVHKLPTPPEKPFGKKCFAGQSKTDDSNDRYVYERYFEANQKYSNGIFVEAGAINGLTISQTLFFDLFLNWTGLLVEPDPVEFGRLKKSNRNAWLLNGCLGRHPTKIQHLSLKTDIENGGRALSYLSEMGGNHSINERFNNVYKQPGYVQVACYPLNLVLEAIGFTHIDLFVLDIEGAEAQFLNTYDISRTPANVFIVECTHCSKIKEKEESTLTSPFIKTLFELNDYEFIVDRNQDHIYARKSFLNQVTPS